ncbi:unnamed protein product [Rotaria sp. Silwood2]|nr:unnamed protein product [Rotaria sp. Silwood2]CAF2891900.1 unnamed protein product [Rotaria sp. Silwood2]CAF3249017.1 unnamed protein product [Rotaria sp. Silwood2]CAF3321406.1 unnamed protein product [Rotaria sp. Silwood2]CAF3897838.1 unnamed protein product [Rotaria sp. Silwood2]
MRLTTACTSRGMNYENLILQFFYLIKYGVRGQSSSTSQNQLVLKPDLIEQAQPINFVFDIECTKMPLKFQSPASDQIMMISYTIDTQGCLIINCEIFSQDIDHYSQDYYLSRPCVYMDCIKWVKRNSYLPIGSHGLKAVKKAKLCYNPIVYPENMCHLDVEQLQTLSN